MTEASQRRPEQYMDTVSPYAPLYESLLPPELQADPVTPIDLSDVLSAVDDRYQTIGLNRDTVHAPGILDASRYGFTYIPHQFIADATTNDLYMLNFRDRKSHSVILETTRPHSRMSMRLSQRPHNPNPKDIFLSIAVQPPNSPVNKIQLRYDSKTHSFESVTETDEEVNTIGNAALTRLIEAIAISDPTQPPLPGTKRTEPIRWEEFIRNTAGDLLNNGELDGHYPDTDMRLLQNYLAAHQSAIASLGYALSAETDSERFEVLQNKQNTLHQHAHTLKKLLGLPTYDSTKRPTTPAITPSPAD